MTPLEATEIREHLIAELAQFGFGDIVDEVQTRLREDYEGNEISRSEYELLSYFLSETIDILKNRSNGRYSELLADLNAFASDSIFVEKVEVEYLDETNKPATFNLKELPSYETIITELQSISEELTNEG